MVTEESGSHLVDVYRAGGINGPWEHVFGPEPDAYHFLDDKFNLPSQEGHGAGLNSFSLARSIYYQVKVTPPSGGANAFTSYPTEIDPGLDKRTRLFKRKILRDQATAFRRLNGVPLTILKRRHWGPHCSHCYDHVLRQATIEHCTQCYGTGYEGGYWNPIAVRGRKGTGPIQTEMTSHGESDIQVVNFTILDYPNLEDKDLIVDMRRNDRYIIQGVANTELKGVIVHQTARTSHLARSAIEYKIPINSATTPALY